MAHLATQTIEAINHAIKRDQGALYRSNLKKVLPHIGDAYRSVDERFRGHLGASILGQECGRAIWYSWRWATMPNFSGQMIRLFNRGHLEEGRIIAALLTIGCQVYQQDANGKQFRVSFADGHAGGSGDGVVIGLPDLPEGVAALLEFKTHNQKSFDKIVVEGVKASKFEHYVQANIYMRKMELPICLYIAVNKNTDELYGELISLDVEIADQFIARGEKLVYLSDPPQRINESPGYWKCRFCDHKPVCHLNARAEVNCRTCRNSVPQTDGKWHCMVWNTELTEPQQLAGCERHQGFL